MQRVSFALLMDLEMRLPFYLHGVGCEFAQTRIRREEGYPQYVWLQTRSGNGELTVHGATVPVAEGMGLFLYPGVAHEYGPTGKDWIVDWIVFEGDRVDRLLRQFGVHESGAYVIEAPERSAERMERMEETIQSGDSFANVRASGMLYDMMLELLQSISDKKQPSAQRRHERLRAVFDYVERHYASSFGLNELAACIGVTPEYFCQLFKQITRMRPFDYVNRYRIEKGRQLLLERPELAVKDVARLCGYESPGYFFTQFKKVSGVTPNDFRSSYRSIAGR